MGITSLFMMKKLILTCLCLLIFLPSNLKAQNDGAAAAVAGVAAIAGILALSSVDDYEDILELDAVEYVISNRPEITQFILKNLKTSGTTDKRTQSSAQYIPFGLTYYIDGQSFQELLLMTASPGWISEYGVDYKKISFTFFKRDDYKELLMTYLNLGSPWRFDDENNIKEILVKEPKRNDVLLYERTEREGKSPIYLSKVNYRLFELEFAKEGAKAKNKNSGRLEQIISFRNFGENAYKIEDFNDIFKVVYNEYSLGLFHIPNKELTTLNHSTINTITQFFAY